MDWVMRKYFGLLLVLFATAAVSAERWPPLPARGFISGRPAQLDDVRAGNAVFVAAVDGTVIGKPLFIQIPQHALLRNTREHVFVVQAEEARGIKMFGVRKFDGSDAVVTEQDLELLGVRQSQ
jgi:hypothetical protein